MTNKSFTVDIYTDKGFFCANVSYPSAVSNKETIQLIAGAPEELSKKLQAFFKKESDLLLQTDRKKYLKLDQYR